MKNNRKALLLLLCAVLMVSASVFGTLAYLTDTEAVTNTFSVGQVGLKLDEAKVNKAGDPVNAAGEVVKVENAPRVTENEYHLLPGHTYTKDPTIHVDANSEDCYLFVKVDNGIKAIETTDSTKTIAAQMADLGWNPIETNSNIYVYAKDAGTDNKTVVSKNAKIVVFNNFTIDGDKVVNVQEGKTLPAGKIDIANYASASNTTAKVIVTAYAVQKDGFENSTPKQIWDTALASIATTNP